MFGLSKEEKKRADTRDRVRRCRENKKRVTESVTPSGNSVTKRVTPENKMLCKCKYYHWDGGKLVCTQCGKESTKVEDKIKRGVFK
ncbi:hypothetical protein M0R72_11415 [Candidatus Pacearchaeota archaeon]|jgi:hypothetical protein|nr:hypothetical protein [Candidatus Pacearchaeota archaeon]